MAAREVGIAERIVVSTKRRLRRVPRYRTVFRKADRLCNFARTPAGAIHTRQGLLPRLHLQPVIQLGTLIYADLTTNKWSGKKLLIGCKALPTLE
jgi:hypothetical protein